MGEKEQRIGIIRVIRADDAGEPVQTKLDEGDSLDSPQVDPNAAHVDQLNKWFQERSRMRLNGGGLN